jgi:hypothetical protein
MTASEVVESAVPAISEALMLQSSNPYATSEPTAKGPRKETSPMLIEATKRSRK